MAGGVLSGCMDLALNHIRMSAFADQLCKSAAAHKVLSDFWSGAKHELGPAMGAVAGAGVAKATGFDPLEGAAAGYGLGSAPGIIHAIKEKRLASKLSKMPASAG